MSRKEWGALALVLGVVLGLQFVALGGEEDPRGDGHVDHAREAPATSGSSESGAEEGQFRTVTLEVRGMT